MKNRRLKESFSNAFRGIFQAYKTERNVRSHTISAFLTIILAIILEFNITEWMFLVLAISSVIVTEILNTAVEYAIDMVCGNTYHEIARYAKDIAAGATLVAAIAASIIGVMLYLPKIIDIIITII
jgi:diacylglycerol kinase